MTVDDVMALLSREVRATWPQARKASALPFPKWWRTATDWLEFHAPDMGPAVARRMVRLVVNTALRAERSGVEPEPWTVPAETRAARSAAPVDIEPDFLEQLLGKPTRGRAA